MDSVLQYITFPVFKTNITIKLKEDALKNQGKKPKKLFFWRVIYPNHPGFFLKSA